MAERLASLGGRPINLYRALANQPALLAGWIELSWALRTQGVTSRALRELVILRTAQAHGSRYEWEHHLRMAAAAGLAEGKVSALAGWRGSDVFTAEERAALALTEGVLEGAVGDEVMAEVGRLFPPPAVVELVLTAGFYTMVPRVLDALQVPLEEAP